jgi:hypothetical protein
MNETKLLVKAILEHAEHFNWTLQGFGMLRLYLSKNLRLHVWTNVGKVPNVSTVHDHPWHFKSTVVAGQISNRLYKVVTGLPATHQFMTIKCGEGGCAMSEPEYIRLESDGTYHLHEGQSYAESKDQIHESVPAIGTVTLVERIFSGDPDLARVFWPIGEKWVSAEPRPATVAEVTEIADQALGRWFQEAV